VQLSTEQALTAGSTVPVTTAGGAVACDRIHPSCPADETGWVLINCWLHVRDARSVVAGQQYTVIYRRALTQRWFWRTGGSSQITEFARGR
jgi:hypothetical protein